MKIIQIANLVTPEGSYGGPLRVAVNQTRALLEANHDVTLIAGAMGYKNSLPTHFDGIPVKLFRAFKPVPQLGFAGIVAPLLLKWLAGSTRSADVFHIHMGRDLVTLPSALVTSRSRVPYFLQTHGMIDPSRKLLTKPLDRHLTLPALRHANGVFYLTDYERRALQDVAPRLSNLRRLHNGVPELSLLKGTEPSAGIEVLYLARLHARKRPLAFVEMAKRLHSKFPEVAFTLVGPDEGEGPAVTSAILRSGMGDKLTWEGAVPPELAVERINRCSVYVLPSVDEPFPMSVLEAMSLGKAVVVTDTCGLAKAIAQADAGCVVGSDVGELTTAVEKLLANPLRLSAAGVQASKLARASFDMKQIVGDLVVAYAEASSERSRS